MIILLFVTGQPKKNNDYFVTFYLPQKNNNLLVNRYCPWKKIDYFVSRYCPLKKSNDLIVSHYFSLQKCIGYLLLITIPRKK